MLVVFQNLEWISLNLFLAVLGLLFGWLFYFSKRTIFSLIFFILWVLFIPNTIYLITDLQHLPKQFIHADFLSKLILLIEYGFLVSVGIISFIVSMYPVDKVFRELKIKRKSTLRFTMLLLVNLFIAFALILGKFQRTHSWYVFTDTQRVITDVVEVFRNPILLGMVIFFGVVINLTYFAFKNIIKVTVVKKLRK